MPKLASVVWFPCEACKTRFRFHTPFEYVESWAVSERNNA